MDYCLKTIGELKQICIQNNIKGISGKKKACLIKIIEENNVKLANTTQPTAETIDDNILPSYLSIQNLLNTLNLDECVEFMKKMPNNSIDMVCTDPPYFLDGLNNHWNKKSLDEKGSSTVVGNLPKGMKFDRNQSKKFNEFYSIVSIEVFRILKPGGSFLSFSSPRLYHSMTMAIEDAGFEIRDMLGWIYTQSQVKAFSQDHIIDNDKDLSIEQKAELKNLCKHWKTPQLKPAIEPICFAVKPIEGRYIDNFKKYGVGLMNTSLDTKMGNSYFPSNIIVTENISEELDKVFLIAKPKKIEKGEYNTHISVKPVNLISHLIKLFTKEGGIILDPFMGSGTTAVACIHTKRNYIGIEVNKEYITISEKRITEALE